MKYALKYILLFLSFFILSEDAWSQKRRSVNYIEIGALLHHTNSMDDESRLNGFRIRTGASRIIQDHFGLGLTLGSDNYRKENGNNYNTLPITINASWYLNPELNGLKADIYAGYSVKLYNTLNRGFTAGAGISYSVVASNRMNLGIQTGYNYQKIDFPSSFNIENDFDIGAIRLGLGITFK